MYKSFLSWRYLLARRTNWIGIVGIFLGVGAMILILSIMTGFLGETKNAVRGSLSDLVIRPDFRTRIDGSKVVSDPAKVLEVVRADPRVAGASAQLSWFGLFTVKGESEDKDLIFSDAEFSKQSGVRLVGIDVADEFQTSELKQALAREPLHGDTRVGDVEHPFAPPPGYDPPGRKLPSVIVGEQLARNWLLHRGSEIEIFTVPPGVSLEEIGRDTSAASNKAFVVAGTFRTQENEMDLGTIYFERNELSKFLGRKLDFTQVLVRCKDFDRDGTAVRDEVAQKLLAADLLRGTRSMRTGQLTEVNTWEDQKGTLLGAIENERVLMAIMLSLVVLVAAFTIFAILSMMVTEKRRDIGILCALGATPGGIQALFLFIAFWDALLGATAGAIAGTWLALKIDPIEQWLSKSIGVQIFNRDVYLFDHIPAIVDPRAVAIIVLGAFVCTLLFAFVPAWRAGRMHPLDALRHE
ncbi:MAG: ABC transporter permease [Planctomycetes bacterium]|nr:ABC transporter permease [Planctomycetota bacterium]